MRFGNAAWGFRETPLEEQLRITRDMGLDVLELGIANAPMDVPLDVTEEELLKIKSLAAQYSVEILCAAAGNDFTKGSANTEKVKQVLDICQVLGVQYLRIFAGFSALQEVTEERFCVMLNALSEVCDYAKEKQVVPVIETHGGVRGHTGGVEHYHSTTTDVDSLRRMIDSLPDNARICFDPANLYAVGCEKPEKIFREFEAQVAYAHFKDFVRVENGYLRPSWCGQSDMDWEAILAAMKTFEGMALFEYENVEDIETGLNKSYQYIMERIHKDE